MADKDTAYEVAVFDSEGLNVIERWWYPSEEAAREQAREKERIQGPGSTQIEMLTWVGADPENPAQEPVVRDQVAILDPNDPELIEYLRLQEKFAGLRLPVPDVPPVG